METIIEKNTPIYSESELRLYEKLHRDLGDEILRFLVDKNVNEIMLNPDGGLWIDSVTDGQIKVGRIEKSRALSLINMIAGINNAIISYEMPFLEAHLPFYKTMRGERFTAEMPPMVSGYAFNLRKKPESIFTLQDYISTDRMTFEQAAVLKEMVCARKNILVCGGPGSGKTTVTNALLVEAVNADKDQRFIILEDVAELQCNAGNKVAMLTSIKISMTQLLKLAMRMRPDRIMVGEVRGAEALDMLKAWNTGCPGGICTVHANGAEEAVQRIADLSMEAGLINPPYGLIKHTIDAIVFVVRNGNQKGFVKNIFQLEDSKDGHFTFKKLA